MATFDADAYRAAREPFVLMINGREWRARLVSAEIVMQVQPALASSDPTRIAKALRTLLRAAFPYRLSMRWLGDPVHHVLHLDPATRNEVIRRFFSFLGGASTVPPETPGTS